MKKTIALLLFCVMSAALLGSALAEGMEIVEDTMQETYEVDGVTLASLHASFPQLAGMGDEAVMERVNAAIRSFILKEGEYDNIREYALDDYTNAPERFAENVYGLEAHAQAELLRGGALLAVRYDVLLETGGPHPWDAIAAQHYDLSTGMPVILETLTEDPETVRARVVMDTLRWIDESGFEAFDNAGEYALDWPLKNALLTGQGLLAFYNEGELGPVSEGPAEILIPYERFRGLLDMISVNVEPAPAGDKMLASSAEDTAGAFADANFLGKVYRLLDKDADAPLMASEVAEMTNLDVQFLEIGSLRGIEYFTALKSLNCSDNFLKTLDVKACPMLEKLDCSMNFLTSLDVAGNPDLTELNCADNLLTTLDVSRNSALVNLFCFLNKLTALDVTQNPALEDLRCSNNQFATLDVSQNPMLARLYCHKNDLPSEDAIIGLDKSRMNNDDVYSFEPQNSPSEEDDE